MPEPAPPSTFWKVGGVRCFRSGNGIVGKKAVLGCNVVVEPRLERGLIELVFPVENKVIGEARPGDIRIGKQIDDILTYGY